MEKPIPELESDTESHPASTESPDSLAAVLGDCWIDSPLGNVASDVPDLPITARSLVGARVGFDRTYDKVYVKATKTRNNLPVGSICEPLSYPPSDASFLTYLSSLGGTIYEASAIYKKLADATRRDGSTAARQSITDQEFKVLESVYLQALVVAAYLA